MHNQGMKISPINEQKRQAGYWLLLCSLILGLFIISGSRADAKIEIKGDDDFKKAVNDCLAEYEKMGGTVGGITKRLKASKNKHVIDDDPDYSSTPSDDKKATDGSGSGSHTRVSQKGWEDYKKKFESLKSKDFCAVLLHELWHSVEADMGTFDRSTKKDNIPVDEFEAVLIQNLYHTVKKLALRETYGGKKVPSDVKVPEVVALPPAGSSMSRPPAGKIPPAMVEPPASSSCNILAFKACADSFSLQGCIDACPYIPAICPPGTSPNTECKATDKTCSDACWNKADAHIATCLTSSRCTQEEVAGSGNAY